MTIGTRIVRAPHGSALSCKGSLQVCSERTPSGYVDESTTHLEEALDKIEGRRRHGIARSIALEANAADARPEILQRDVIPDIVTDLTSAHDALHAYVPRGMSLADDAVLRERHPEHYIDVKNAFDIPGVVPEYVRPLFCEGEGPFRWAALSGDPDDMSSDRRGPADGLVREAEERE